ncbi:MAG: alpha/beta fold hydrolase [Acidimicrobiales bacterium]
MDGALAHDDRGSGPMLVFLHGITANRAHWGPVVERLTDRFRCVNVDLLGHGASPPGESTDLLGQIEAVASVLDTPPDELLGQVRATLPAVAAPYLGLFGTSLSDEERALQALIPDSRVEVWDGQGHFLHLVDPDLTADRIARFVACLGD